MSGSTIYFDPVRRCPKCGSQLATASPPGTPGCGFGVSGPHGDGAASVAEYDQLSANLARDKDKTATC